MNHAFAFDVGPSTLSMPVTSRGAEISNCRRFRYRLWRVWDAARPCVLFVMLNPSTADADDDDSTIRRCIGFASRWGFGGMEVVNLYAWRETDSTALKKVRHCDPVGPDNDAYLWGGLMRCPQIVCAWGAHDLVDQRAAEVLDLIRRAGAVPMCLGVSKVGHPLHPLYLKGDLLPVPFDGMRYVDRGMA